MDHTAVSWAPSLQRPCLGDPASGFLLPLLMPLLQQEQQQHLPCGQWPLLLPPRRATAFSRSTAQVQRPSNPLLWFLSTYGEHQVGVYEVTSERVTVANNSPCHHQQQTPPSFLLCLVCVRNADFQNIHELPCVILGCFLWSCYE